MDCKTSLEGKLDILDNLRAILKRLLKKLGVSADNALFDSIFDVAKKFLTGAARNNSLKSAADIERVLTANIGTLINRATSGVNDTFVYENLTPNIPDGPMSTEIKVNTDPTKIIPSVIPPKDTALKDGDDVVINLELINIIRNFIDTVAVNGTPLSREEIENFYRGVIIADDEEFNILEWIPIGSDVLANIQSLSYAKTIHKTIILPCVKYFKLKDYGDENYPRKLSYITAGIIQTEYMLLRDLTASSISRHIVGQSVSFGIRGIDDVRIIAAVLSKRIKIDVGTFGMIGGVHATLPFYTRNSELVKSLYLYSKPASTNIGHKFF